MRNLTSIAKWKIFHEWLPTFYFSSWSKLIPRGSFSSKNTFLRQVVWKLLSLDLLFQNYLPPDMSWPEIECLCKYLSFFSWEIEAYLLALFLSKVLYSLGNSPNISLAFSKSNVINNELRMVRLHCILFLGNYYFSFLIELADQISSVVFILYSSTREFEPQLLPVMIIIFTIVHLPFDRL